MTYIDMVLDAQNRLIFFESLAGVQKYAFDLLHFDWLQTYTESLIAFDDTPHDQHTNQKQIVTHADKADELAMYER
jgi:hypothetical protein